MVHAETGTDQENGVNKLPENATALEMRQWADRMLGRSAEQQEDGAGATSLSLSECPLLKQLTPTFSHHTWPVACINMTSHST